jgi:hypothetical protein
MDFSVQLLRRANQEAAMPWSCYSYPSGLPSGAGNSGASRRPLPDVRRMPFSCYSYPNPCFDYPADVLPETGNPGLAQPALRRPHSCFRY